MRRLLVGAALLVLLAACGGSGGLSRADYVKQANAVCRDGAKQIAALEVPSDVTGLPAAAARVVAVQRTTLDRLRAIHPPKADKSQIVKWIALVDQTVDQAEMSATSQRDGDIQRAVTANVNGAALDVRADEIARGYGLKMCVQAATAPTTTTTTKPRT
jgi:uncharacterized lipoprotein